jgi:ABC-type uncharacterized transport system ATPase subunit
MTEPILEMRNITKRFPGVTACDKVNLTLYHGEVHALLGENGAGKSTLMNILTGIYTPNEGTIVFKGKAIDIRNPRTAVDLGIGMVHQHFKLVDTLTVADNIFIAAGKGKLFLNRKEMEQSVCGCAKEYNMDVDPSARIWQISVGEQQQVEILKLLYCGAEVLILDEPTSVLTPQESRALFSTLHRMAESGKSVLFITHKMFEVMTYSDRITVLRNGKSLATMLTEDTTREELTHIMVGRELGVDVKSREDKIGGETVLELKDVSVMGDRGLLNLKNASLRIHQGEILGIAGVAGSGQRELAEVIAGLRQPTAGQVLLEGEDVFGKPPSELIRLGVAYIPEDRMGVGLVASMNMMENVILRSSTTEPFSKKGILQHDEILAHTEQLVEDYDIKNAGLSKPVRLMSGGNLQKLLLGREVAGLPKIIVAAYPVHGVDISATEAIHNILFEQRNQGAAILLISENLEELMKMADRIAALFEGEIMGVVDIAEATYDGVGQMMLGQRHEDAGREEAIHEDAL